MEDNKDQVELHPNLLALEEFQLSMTMLIILKPIVKDTMTIYVLVIMDEL